MTTKPFFIGGLAALLLVAGSVHGDTASLIQELQSKIQELQKQLSTLRVSQTGTVEGAPFRVVGVGFSETLRRGSRGDAVTRLQEFLKTKTGSYPDGLVTGYFGTLTEDAVKRFQATYGIDAVGTVGPKTRAKLNQILLAGPVPPPEPPPAAIPSPPPAASTPPPPAGGPPTPPPPPAPAYIPTTGQLGQPTGTFLGWSDTAMVFEFTHDPMPYTHAYSIYTKKSGGSEESHGPYSIEALSIGQPKTNADGTTIERLGTTGWRWSMGIGSSTESTYEARATARGDGNSEGPSSPGRIAALYLPIQFDDFLQGIPERAVIDGRVSSLPLKLRIKNPYAALYYRYRIYDATTLVWESGLIKQSQDQKIQASFTNANGYQFASATPYRLQANAYDNDAARNSETKQLPAETSLFFSL